MSKLKKDEVLDPTLPFTPVTINGKEYRICFNFSALAKAEARLNRAGHDVTILTAMPNFRQMEALTALFAASLGAYHPELTFEDAEALLTFSNVYDVMIAVRAEIKQAFPDPPAPAL